MEAQFIEIISQTELKKLRKAVELSKELSILNRENNLRKTFDDLYSLKNECDRVFFKINKMQKKHTLCTISIKNEEGFTNIVPNMLYNLLTAIEKGELIFKDAKVQ